MTAISAQPGNTGREPASGPYPMGLMVLLATVTMLFAAFTAAILVRRTADDWEQIRIPAVLWLNTAILVLSSVFVEVSRSAVRHDLLDVAEKRLGLAAFLGILFVAGQAAAWGQLVQWGQLLRTGPHVAFFYIISILHALHLTAGIIALVWTLRRMVRGAYTARQHGGLTHAAVFWHFLGGTWLFLFGVLLLL